MKFVVTLIAFVVLCVSAGEAYRFGQGRHTKHYICEQIAIVKKILNDEHRTQRLNQRVYLKQHPNGIPSIGVSRQDVLDSIAEQTRIIKQTKPPDCP